MIGNQVRKIRKKRNLTQEDMALVLGISRSVYSDRERNIKPFSAEELQILSVPLGVSVTEFYATDDPGMILIAEPEMAIYKAIGIDISDEAIQKRYAIAIDLLKEKNKTTLTATAEYMKVDYSHMNGVRTDKKPLSMTLLTHAGKYGGISANYILYDIEPVTLSELKDQTKEINRLKVRIEELETDKRNQQLVINSYASGAKQTG